MNVDYGKMLITILIVIGTFIGIFTGDIPPDAGIPVITLIVGYIFGNGKNAIKGEHNVPVIGASTERIVEKIVQKRLDNDSDL